MNPVGDKKIIISAGPNGGGKTTFAGEFLPNEAACPVFVNADLIAAGLHNPEHLYKPLVDEWAVYDNSGVTPQLLEEATTS